MFHVTDVVFFTQRESLVEAAHSLRIHSIDNLLSILATNMASTDKMTASVEKTSSGRQVRRYDPALLMEIPC